MVVLDILFFLLIGTTLSNFAWYSALLSVMEIAGYWGIFRKFGVRGWYALIPCYREYKLADCAGMELEGRILFSLNAVTMIFGVLSILFPAVDQNVILGLGVLMLTLITLVYQIRVFINLCLMFNRPRRWLILWIFFTWVAACIFGWCKKFQPEMTIEEIHSEAANYFSNSKAAVLDKGLTVNLEERTATEFFKKKYLLRDIHMLINPGHMVLLLGGSGAGKTTFLNAVNGYEKARAEVVLNGKNMYTNYKEMQYDIGFVPQADLMRGSDSVIRTLLDAAMLRLPKNLSADQRRARVEEVMEIFGLSPVQNNLVSKLSGGQRKRLSIAMEFISNPSLFILDEPDSGLDGVMARELFEQLRQIADQGKIIIVITHTPDRVIDLFDDVIVLAKDANRTGRLAYFGPIEEAKTFFGKEHMEEIVKSVNRTEEGGEGRADEFILKYAEVQHV